MVEVPGFIGLVKSVILLFWRLYFIFSIRLNDLRAHVYVV
ncbi:hypothetical protein DSUL_50430 [Desulfovibrionales bacterium]